MFHYLIYFLDNKKNDLITIRETYKNKNDAIINIEKIALDYIKNIEGEKQLQICKQDKTPDQIVNDINLRNGLYIIKHNNIVTLYEKTTQIIQGTIWNGYKNGIEKIGIFGMIEYKIDDNLIRCVCNEPKRVIKEIKTISDVKSGGFLDELKKIINDTDGKFNLKNNKQI
jgi:hypothetical protein